MNTRKAVAGIIACLAGATAIPAEDYVLNLVAGGGVQPTPVAAAQAAIRPFGTAVGADGSAYFVSDNCVFRLDASGVVTRYAGSSQVSGFSGDGGPAVDARLAYPTALAVDSAGNLYIADSGNARVRRVAPDGTITTVAGNSRLAAWLSSPSGVAADSAGNLYIADLVAGRISKVASDGVITTIAGSGSDQEGVLCSAGRSSRRDSSECTR